MEPGLRGTATTAVTDADTAISHGSGDVAVWATPAVVALAEAAAVAAVEGSLQEATTTVGTRIELDHLAPTPVGGEATAEAVLTAVDGRTLRFDVSVTDGSAEVARGTHVRVVVDRLRFMASVG